MQVLSREHDDCYLYYLDNENCNILACHFCNSVSLYFTVPVTKPIVHTEPSSGVVEYVGNITLKCTMGKGTRVVYQWMKNGKRLRAGPNYTFSSDNSTLLIVPVVKEDIGNYSCLVSNPVSAMESEIIAPTIYCEYMKYS